MPKWPLGSKRALATQSKTTKAANTIHPCHAQGSPQPQPYFLAGNHIFFPFVFIISFSFANQRKFTLENVASQGASAQP